MRRANAGAAEGGFSLVEVLIAGAIVVLLAFAGLAACKTLAQLTRSASLAGRDADALEAFTAELRNDAASAIAVFVPAVDMLGRPNRVAGGGHELDFYAKGSNGQDLFWRYIYDPAQQTLQRFDSDASSVHGVRDPFSGAVDGHAAYPALHGVTAFSAATIGANDLGDAAQNVYSGVAALLAHPAAAHAVSYRRPGPDLPEVQGGNAVVQVSLTNRSGARIVHLLAGSLPTGFTLTGLPRWHAILFRTDQTHRSGFGFVGKSHVFINAFVEVTYGPDWGPRSKRIPWCIFNVLGDPDGLDGHDPHADYKPDEPFEQAEALLADCRRTHPTPPPPEAPATGPDTLAVATAPVPGPTPPPCWTAPGPAGRCWPADAPADWIPPAPLPQDTPPPAWCATHAQSMACPAPGGR